MQMPAGPLSRRQFQCVAFLVYNQLIAGSSGGPLKQQGLAIAGAYLPLSQSDTCFGQSTVNAREKKRKENQ
jgi:hypothetical protein